MTSMIERTQDQIDAEMFDTTECWSCGGEGFIDGECTCGDDCCCCLEPTPPRCDICKGKGFFEQIDAALADEAGG